MQCWLNLLLFVTAVMLLMFIVWTTIRPLCASVRATYPDGIELGGSVSGGRVSFLMVQWVSDPARPGSCPLVIHLPKGDLGGDVLCASSGPAAAEQLGSPAGLDVFPFAEDGKVVGVRVGPLPGCPPIEMSVAGRRFTLPLSEEGAARVLGDPIRRIVLDSSGRPRPEAR